MVHWQWRSSNCILQRFNKTRRVDQKASSVPVGTSLGRTGKEVDTTEMWICRTSLYLCDV